MEIRLRTQMVITHGLIAVITIFLVVIAAYILINQRFLHYIDEKQVKDQQNMVNSFSQAYDAGGWNDKLLDKYGQEALLKGYLVKVLDQKRQPVWNPDKADKNIYQQAIREIEKRLAQHYGYFEPSIKTTEYKLTKDKQNIGSLEISAYRTHFLTEHDLMFIGYLNNTLLWVAGFSFLFTLILSNFISSKIAAQLGRLLKTAKRISRGQDNKKSELIHSHIVEIKELIEAIQGLEESILEKEAGNKRLTADIAHELRTPLSTMQSHLEAILEGIWQPTPERLASCHEEIVRMAALVNDLEKLNKYDQAQMRLKKTTFDITELVQKIGIGFERDFAQKNLRFKLSGESCFINADRGKVGQVLVNLLSNSLKYTVEGGRVFVNITRDSNFVYLIINDNGIGISQSDLSHVFERLYRADVSRTRSTGGAGIGLAIAKAIVEAHMGQISVVSQEGKGTEFTVILPLGEVITTT